MHLIPEECPGKQTKAVPGQPEVLIPGVKMVAPAPAVGSGWKERKALPCPSWGETLPVFTDIGWVLEGKLAQKMQEEAQARGLEVLKGKQLF